MGGGRKTKTVIVNEKEKYETNWSWNQSVTARNLRKSDLAGVIFGCKHFTIRECLREHLFGLPAPHFSYVKNIDPGLPLFLFNYSDRKLYGIFEAATHGRLNINPNAWTNDDGSDTPYPAQVRIRVRMECQPLQENQFGPIIADNYYEQKLFWFELDCHQTKNLISMFSSVQISPSSSLSKTMDKKSTLFKALYLANGAQGESVKTHLLNTHSYPNKANTECGSFWDDPDLGKDSCMSETVSVDAEKNEDGVGTMEPNDWSSFAAAVRGVQTSPKKTWSSLFKDSTTSDGQKGVEHVTTLVQELNVTIPYQSKMEWNSSCFVSDLVTESHPLDALLDEDGEEMIDEENVCFKLVGENMSKHSNEDSLVDGVISDANSPPEAPFALEMESSAGVQSIVAKLVEEVRELKSSHLKQVKKIRSLDIDLVNSKSQIQALKDRLNLLEFVSSDEEGSNKPVTNIDESILIIGGFDGSTWLSALDCYHPSRDVLESLCPMSIGRSRASAAKLNDEIYVFGGVCGDLWSDRVESYNPVKNQWSIRPSLSQRKGYLAGISYDDKIFAIGGGNGVESLSEVEMFDLDVGRWIPSLSMLQKRFAPAVAEINGAIYVAGGFDGQDYLKSMERFDPREHSWKRLPSMSSKRGCHSLAVLNEKLYAIGGFDGEKMVSTVEAFDPRKSSWIMEDSMKESRGYSSAVVIGDAIHVIGGFNEGNQVLDTVECYKEGLGWLFIDSKAIGKRAFFSAYVVGA